MIRTCMPLACFKAFLVEGCPLVLEAQARECILVCIMASLTSTRLFGIYATATHEKIGSMLNIMAMELAALTGLYPIHEEEFTRAKNQLRSGIFMNLEQRGVLCDDIGRQVLSYGERKSAQELSDLIEKVTIDDAMRVARRILSSKPTLVVYTPEKYVKLIPSYDQLCDWFHTALNENGANQRK